MDLDIGNGLTLQEHFEVSDIDAERYIAVPEISSLTLISNWNHLSEESLNNAIQNLVKLNPILTGRLIKDTENNKLKVLSGAHSNFYDVIEERSDIAIPTDIRGRINFLHTDVEPHFEDLGMSMEQITKGGKLFSVSV